MQWPASTFASELFPSLKSSSSLPVLPENEPVWKILDSDSQNNLKSQLDSLLERSEMGSRKNIENCTIDESQGKVFISKTARIEPGAHFVGPCFVGDNAEIRHSAYVRAYSWICDSAVVGHCTEVKHSILLPGAKAPHFNYVGDSILGSGVNLGAGTKLSNLRNDGKEVHVRINNERIGSGLRKFGAILGEGCQLGCNSVTNPGVVLGCNSAVFPNSTVTGIHEAKSTHI